jgi:hypothetical protein
MNTEAAKKKRERLVFEAFIKKSGLQIGPESIQSCDPPEPDIVCWQENEGKIAFELTEICDEAVARVTSTIKGSDQPVYIRGSDPTWKAREKLKKRYETEYPVELLCYTAARTMSPDDLVRDKLRSMAEMDNGQFRHIWLLLASQGQQRDLVYLVWP